MKILIIGGTGVLSSAVVNEAIKQDIHVTMINRGNNKEMIPQNTNLILADKNDKTYISHRLENCYFDAIIDFLCISEDELKESFTFYASYTNQYIYISSCAVYDTSKGGIYDEDSPKGLAIWKYSLDKLKSEVLLENLSSEFKINYTIVRPSITYGNTRIPYGVTPKYGYHWTLIERINHNKPIIRWKGGNTRCNITRVEDFSIGLVGLIGNKKAYNEAFNICGDETPSFNNVLNVLSELTGKKVLTIDIASEFYASHVHNDDGEIVGGRSIDACNSNKKIKSVVPSFKQNIFLKEGIGMTYNAYKNNIQKGIDWDFDGECDRIILEWCKKNKLDREKYKLGYIDYLGNATYLDKIKYFKSYHKNHLYIKIVNRILKLIRLIKTILRH